MTNREKFAERILDIACSGDSIAVNKVTLEPIRCRGTACKECLFNFNGNEFCIDKRKKWANSEYVEPPIDWSKVAVDTPILVNDSNDHGWVKRYLQNMRTEAFSLGMVEKHRGVVRDMQQRGD